MQITDAHLHLDVDATCLDALPMGASKAPPTEFRIFRAGANPSTKGDFLFDDKAAKAVMAKYRQMGRRVTFDYDHGALRKESDNPAQTAKSAGSCDLAVRNGELWAVDCRFTPQAAAGISSGEWPYFSPAFSRDGQRPNWLINIALTANPSLHNLDELAVAASALFADVIAAEGADGLDVAAELAALKAEATAAYVALGFDPSQARDANGQWTSGGAASAGNDAADKGAAAAKASGNAGTAAAKASSDARDLSESAHQTGSASTHRAAEAQHTLAATLHRAAAGKATVAVAKQVDQARAARVDEVLGGKTHISQIGGSFAGRGTDDVQNRVHWAATKAAELRKPIFMVPMKPGQERHSSEGGLKLATKAPGRGDYHVVHPDGRIEHVTGKPTKASVDVHDPADLLAVDLLDDAEMLSALERLGFDPGQARDAGGQWSASGGSAPTGAMSQVGGGHQAPAAVEHKTPAPAATVAAPDQYRRGAVAQQESARVSARADKISAAARAKPSAESHAAAADANRIAAGMHRVAAELDHEHADAHKASADWHERAAAFHEDQAARHAPAAVAATVLAVSDAVQAPSAADRLEQARKTASMWAANNLGVYGPVGNVPQHPAATALPTFVYPNANAAGWCAAIEPTTDEQREAGDAGPTQSGDWVAFVKPDGRTALWERRADDGSVVGTPTVFQRDLANLTPKPTGPAMPSTAQTEDQAGETRSGPVGEPVQPDADRDGDNDASGAPSSRGAAAVPGDGAATPAAPATPQPGPQRRAAGQFSYGRDLGPGQGGLAAGISHRADQASHAAKVAGTPDAHRDAADVNDEVADEHRDLADAHRAMAAKYPEHADLHQQEADVHDQAADTHEARADAHDDRARADALMQMQEATDGASDADAALVALDANPDQARQPAGQGNGGQFAPAGGGGGGGASGGEGETRKPVGHDGKTKVSPGQEPKTKVSEPEKPKGDDKSKAEGEKPAPKGDEKPAVGGKGEQPKGEGDEGPHPSHTADEAGTKAAEASKGALDKGGSADHKAAADAHKDAAAAHKDAAKAAKAAGDNELAAHHLEQAAAHAAVAGEHRRMAADAQRQERKAAQDAARKRAADAAAARRNAAQGAKGGDFIRNMLALIAKGSVQTAKMIADKAKKGGGAGPGAGHHRANALTALSAAAGGAIPYAAHPLAPADHAWDATAAIQRVRRWASRDGSGDPDTIDWQKYGQAFAYQDPPGDDGPKLGDFHLPHHDVVNGSLVTVPRAVYAAAAAINGARGGVSIPAAHLADVKRHIAQHYHQMGQRAPWETNETASATALSAGPDTERPTMHKALKAYCDALDIGKTACKAKIKLGVPKDMHEDAMKALSDDPADHPDDAFAKKVVGHLKALDDRTDAAAEAHAKALNGGGDGSSPIEDAAKGKLSVAALSALGVSCGLPAGADADQVVRTALASVEVTRELCSALNVKSAEAVIGAIEALKATAEEGRLVVERDKATAAQREYDAAALSVTTAEKEGRLNAAKKVKAEGMLAAKQYERLTAFLDGCDVIVPPSGGTTQLSAAQQAALAGAGQHPGSSGAGPSAQPGSPGAPSGAPAPPPADDAVALKAIMAEPDFHASCKAFGISETPVAMAAFARQLLDDRRGVTTSMRIEQLSAAH